MERVRMPIDYGERRNYSLPKSVVFRKLLNVLTVLGLKIKESSESTGLIEASKGMSFRSWGARAVLEDPDGNLFCVVQK